MKISDAYKEISLITQKFISNGLSIEERWPKIAGHKISWVEQTDISISLKNIPYAEKYKILSDDRNFNFKMLDGALIQMMYEYDRTGKTLISHRLAFFPSPTMENYDTVPEDYEEKYFGESEFHDMADQNMIAFPIRFDYHASEEKFVEIDHPYSHATLGEYKNCRIPVSSPLTPGIFTNFILRNFYNYAVRTKGVCCISSNSKFANTIANAELNIFHFNII